LKTDGTIQYIIQGRN